MKREGGRDEEGEKERRRISSVWNVKLICDVTCAPDSINWCVCAILVGGESMCALVPFNPVLPTSPPSLPLPLFPSPSSPPSCRVPSDDHYATNVPNDVVMALPPMEACGGVREEVGEKIKAKREDLLCTEQGT